MIWGKFSYFLIYSRNVVMESTFELPIHSLNQPHEYARRYASSEWETIKPQIKQLYVQEKRTLREVINILKQENGLTISYVVVILIFLIVFVWMLRFRQERSR